MVALTRSNRASSEVSASLPTSLMPLDLRSADAMLALQSMPRIGPVAALKAAIRSSWSDPPRVDAVQLEQARERTRELLDEYGQAGVSVVTYFDDAYPPLLRRIPDPPPILYVRGDLGPVSDPRAVAVVGTREPTQFGTTAAQQLTVKLSDAGWVIVSGLAKGIDTIAHQAALAAGGRTVAILGRGLDGIYPRENSTLADAILASGGALLSELPFGAPPIARNLIQRDRLQSGMSGAVVIAQTGTTGGALHTARFAAEQRRQIFCPEPHSENGKNEGLRVLLERPAADLYKVLAAWKSASKLCAQFGPRPLARPVRRDQVGEFLNEVEVAATSATADDQESLVIPALTG
jgi:DNA processing protein